MKIIKILSILLVSFQLVACDQIAVEEICEQKIDMKSQCPCIAEVLVLHNIVKEKEVEAFFTFRKETLGRLMAAAKTPWKNHSILECFKEAGLMAVGQNLSELKCFNSQEKKWVKAMADVTNTGCW